MYQAILEGGGYLIIDTNAVIVKCQEINRICNK
jgi:hypothetical protein